MKLEIEYKDPAVFIYSSGILIDSGTEMNNAVLAGNCNNSMFVNNGGMASDTRLESGGSMYVTDGGNAADTIVNGGYMHISSGGEAAGALVNSGNLIVSEGGKITDTRISGGYVNVSSGGQASGVTVNSGGTLLVSSGGSALDVVWTPCVGKVTALGGAYVTYTSNYTGVYFGSGQQLLSHAENMDGKTLSGSLNSMYIMNGGQASGTVLNGGYMYVFSNGKTVDTEVNSNAIIYVYEHGSIENTQLNSGAVYISSGGAADNITVNSGTSLYISSGGSATNIYWNPCYGKISAYEGAYVTYAQKYTGIYLGSDNALAAHEMTMDGTVVSGTTKLMYVMSGGTAANTKVNRNGSMFISSGGSADRTVINSNGSMFVAADGAADNTTVNSNGKMFVSSGGAANNTTVKTGGSMTILSGGCVDNLLLETGGALGGIIFNTNKNFTGISDGTVKIADNVTLCNNILQVSAGGNIADISVSNNGSMFVDLGGTADRITTQAGHIYVNGQINSANIKLGGEIHISAGGIADKTVMGLQNDNSGIAGGGQLRVSSGGVAKNTNINVGDLIVSSGGNAENTVIRGGKTHVHEGGVITMTTVDSNGYLNISGGTADDVTVLKGGQLTVLSGGTAANVVWTPCIGNVDIADGATVTFVNEYSGVYLGSNGGLKSRDTLMTGQKVSAISNLKAEMYVMNGGTAAKTELNANGVLYVFAGGSAENTTAASDGKLKVYSGGIAEHNTLSDKAEFVVCSGGTAADTTLAGSAAMYVSNGGCGGNITVSEKAAVILSSGGTAADITVNTGGTALIYHNAAVNELTLLAGAYLGGFSFKADKNFSDITGGKVEIAPNVDIRGDKMHVSSGGYITDTTITGSSHGSAAMLIFDGGLAELNQVNSGGKIFVYNGGTARSTEVRSKGYVYVSSGGCAKEILLSSGGLMYVSNGGTATGTTVSSGGSMYISSGGIHDGKLQIASGGKFHVYSGGVVNFSLPDNPADNDYFVNNIAGITGTPEFTITVAADQFVGEYKIAQGANGFNYSITITDGSNVFGSLTAGSEFVYNGLTYELKSADNKLSLVICAKGDIEPGTSAGVNWVAQPGISTYVLDYSRNNYAQTFRIYIQDTKVDTYGMSSGDFQWRVQPDGSNIYTNEGTFTVTGDTVPEVFISDGEGNMDLFFARGTGVWSAGYAAQHQGVKGQWDGTMEHISLAKKNILADIFQGSIDANMLLMTDDANGDALFLDDIFTALPGTLTEQQARVKQIDEICAGAGDDVIDLTSQRFDYIGDGMTVRGGLGNDTIWANNGSNILFGDAGNDRIVGGVGNDIIIGGSGNDTLTGGGGIDEFIFAGEWGNDIVKQVNGGEIILWFESYDPNNWDAEMRVYSDGKNSVTVSGDFTVKYLENDPVRYEELSALGVFDGDSSEKIFEDNKKGFLA